MGYHVFIVNDDTFPSHLNYLFAGTGAKRSNVETWLDWHIGLLTDITKSKARGFSYILYRSDKKS